MLLVTWTFPISECQLESLLLGFPSSFLLTGLRKQCLNVQILDLLPHIWGNWMEFSLIWPSPNPLSHWRSELATQNQYLPPSLSSSSSATSNSKIDLYSQGKKKEVKNMPKSKLDKRNYVKLKSFCSAKVAIDTVRNINRMGEHVCKLLIKGLKD